jgi:hypothetical protein
LPASPSARATSSVTSSPRSPMWRALLVDASWLFRLPECIEPFGGNLLTERSPLVRQTRTVGD